MTETTNETQLLRNLLPAIRQAQAAVDPDVRKLERVRAELEPDCQKLEVVLVEACKIAPPMRRVFPTERGRVVALLERRGLLDDKNFVRLLVRTGARWAKR